MLSVAESPTPPPQHLFSGTPLETPARDLTLMYVNCNQPQASQNRCCYLSGQPRSCTMKTIFAAIDLDSNVDDIIKAASDLARQYGAELILATVETELPGMEGAADEEVATELQASYGSAITRLQQMASDQSAQGINCRAVLLEGKAVDQLVKTAERLEVDLIVIGNRGHSPFYDTLIGGTAPGVIHRAKQKVLLVPVTN
ncbi:MAG: universal stress protein [Gammaproteobacteria bacterium]|nr:MAG: universal stress protein [Gammaproteobacteria bacterium]